MYKKSYCSTTGIPVNIDGGGGISKMLNFCITSFYVIGKVLSGELSCMQKGHVHHDIVYQTRFPTPYQSYMHDVGICLA